MMILDPVFYIPDPTSLADWLYDHICDRIPKRRWVPSDPSLSLCLFIIIACLIASPRRRHMLLLRRFGGVGYSLLLHADHVEFSWIFYSSLFTITSPLLFFFFSFVFSIYYTFDLHNRSSLTASRYTNSFHCIPISMVIIIVITIVLCVQVLSSILLTNALLL